jgi:LPPG:FO 2-phospho-L-lactate transferase
MKLTALAGGIGAAKLLSGMVRLLPPEDITVIVNTGDDFRWMGLYICPDPDTILYTISGQVNPETGWGMREDSFQCLARLARLGADSWFRIGDRDLATHLFRTNRLQQGDSLSEVTAALCALEGVRVRILPMSDKPVPTMLHTDEGVLALQDYFVRRKCAPGVFRITHHGADDASPAPGVLEAIRNADALLICPSNPYISIGPILAVPGIEPALRAARARVIAVSPIVAGEAIKGPAAAMMRNLATEVSAAAVAGIYRDFLDVFVLDRRDRHLCDSVAAMGIEVVDLETVMVSTESKVALAQSILEILE